MPKLIIMQGIPCSGKSTWAYNQPFFLYEPYGEGYITLCRDVYREEMAKDHRYKNYKFSKENEERISKLFIEDFYTSLKAKYNIIVDNTNLKPKYYNWMVLDAEKAGYEVEFRKFPISLWKAQYRNIMRWIDTGGDKYIPWKVMKDMYRNYKKLN